MRRVIILLAAAVLCSHAASAQQKPADQKALTLDEVKKLGGTGLVAGFEGSGNRGPLQGLAGNGKWTGIPLKTVLAAAGVKANAKDIVFFGADHGEEEVEWRTQKYKVGNFAPATIAWGEPIRFDDLPRGAKGYRAASKEIEAEINRLWTWARDIHEAGRPRNAVPPRAL